MVNLLLGMLFWGVIVGIVYLIILFPWVMGSIAALWFCWITGCLLFDKNRDYYYNE